MAEQPQSVTSVELSPEDDRRARVLKYSITMAVRLACVFLAVSTHGILMWIACAGAIFLPYFAVVIANVTGSTKAKKAKAVAPLAAAKISVAASDFKIVGQSDSAGNFASSSNNFNE